MRVVILGAGGHAKAVGAVLIDRHGPLIRPYCTEDDDEVRPDDEVHIGVGDMKIRRRLFARFREQIPDRGVQLMTGVLIGPDCTLGNNVLVNTGAQINHDCAIGDHCIISPGAILCGGVALGEGCFVGAGAVIIEGVTLGPETFVPAGTLVVASGDFRKPQRDVRI